MTSNKQTKPARKPANSRPEWGSTPDGPFVKIRELANSKHVLMKIHQKQKKAPARKSANSRPEWGFTPDGPFFKIRELANSILF